MVESHNRNSARIPVKQPSLILHEAIWGGLMKLLVDGLNVSILELDPSLESEIHKCSRGGHNTYLKVKWGPMWEKNVQKISYNTFKDNLLKKSWVVTHFMSTLNFCEHQTTSIFRADSVKAFLRKELNIVFEESAMTLFSVLMDSIISRIYRNVLSSILNNSSSNTVNAQHVNVTLITILPSEEDHKRIINEMSKFAKDDPDFDKKYGYDSIFNNSKNKKSDSSKKVTGSPVKKPKVTRPVVAVPLQILPPTVEDFLENDA